MIIQPNRKPVVFIGSASEKLDIAKEIERVLKNVATVVPWYGKFFRPMKSFLEELVDRADEFDFAILLVTDDDHTHSRGKRQSSPRDNILFELGLFMGKLGRDRTYLVHPKGVNLKLPSDFSGCKLISYDGAVLKAPNPSKQTIAKALKPAAEDLIEAIKLQMVKYPENWHEPDYLAGWWKYRVNNHMTKNTLYGIFKIESRGRAELRIEEGAVWYSDKRPLDSEARARWMSEICAFSNNALRAIVTVLTTTNDPRAKPTGDYKAFIIANAISGKGQAPDKLQGNFSDFGDVHYNRGDFFAQKATKQMRDFALKEAAREFGIPVCSPSGPSRKPPPINGVRCTLLC